MIPETISHYKIIRKLGAGGMGEVYLAEDTRLGRRVALKILSPEFTSDEERLRRFEQEARAASALNHPNIITIHEVGLDKNTRFISTEFIEGETLRRRLATAKMSLHDALDVAIQVAGALDAAHRAGIVHRDVKPENIMLRPDGYAKVLDFGIVKLTEKFTEQQSTYSINAEDATVLLVNTDANMVMGSPSYMSPEQARGLKVDSRTDIFSLGVVIYEMVAGKRPFDGETASDVIANILERNPPPLAHYTIGVPETLEWIVLKALRKNRDERYQTARGVLNDLRALKQRVEFEVELERSVNPGPMATVRVAHSAVTTVKDLAAESDEIAAAPTLSSAEYIVTEFKRHKKAVALIIIALMLAVTATWFFFHKSQVLNERDTVLLADFVNSTGDVVFDGTLKQALAVQLEQSPFLNIFSDERIRETLRYMSRSPEERLTIPVAREVCQRQGLKALLTGSISSLGSNYVISLEAMNAYTGDVIAREQVEAENKEQVLRALGTATSKLRERLGESLRMIEKFDAPIEQATTSSLEALKAFSLGNEQQNRSKYLEAIPFYKRAIELDPTFALAYTRLAVAYDNSRQLELAAESATKAFELRDRVSERERHFISWRYYSSATRELDKTIDVLELWKQTYPRDIEPHNTLSFHYTQIGQFGKAIEEAREAIRLNPARPQPYSNLGLALMCMNRFDEAGEVYQQALAQNLDTTAYHWGLYLIASVQGNADLMKRHLDWMNGKSNEYDALDWQAKYNSFLGQLRKATELSELAGSLAKRGNLNEIAAQFAARARLRMASVGACQEAENTAPKAEDRASTNTSVIEDSVALALCGQTTQAHSLIDELSKRFPQDTLLNTIWIPTIRAIIEINRNNAAQAIQLLQATKRYELGYAAGFWPSYIRGQAYLRQRAGTEAAAEFQKILNNRGININSNLYSLAYLGLARATTLTGDRVKARNTYEDFFKLWKEADPDMPVLQQAKQEYEKLK
jgi:serine/threonine protein kinase/tetratricopeptide (TPR) repeat protein